MAIVNLSLSDLRTLVGGKVSEEQLLETMPQLGGDVDKRDGDAVAMEYFPDRPDLLSVEGIARAVRAYRGLEPGLKKYKVEKGSAVCTVDASVKKVRPVIVMAYVRGVNVDEAQLLRIIEIQEKLHYGLGKRRKRVAIGVHDALKVEAPFKYWASAPDAFSFVPLQSTQRMTLREILERHEKGKDYAHLLAGLDKYPLITDRTGEVLSFPPVINGRLTTVTTETGDLLLDATGSDMESVAATMAILVTALAERGGRIESVTMKYGSKSVVTPDLSPRKGAVALSKAESLLGVKVGPKDAVRYLRRLGHDAKASGGKVHVRSARWRADIMHPVDFVEDIAKGIGYMSFDRVLPTSATFGKPLPRLRRERAARSSLSGLGFLEVTTLTLSSEEDQFDRMGLERRPVVQVTNPISIDHTCMRVSVLPSLLRLLAANKGRDLPQSLFEIGDVITMDDGTPANLRLVAGARAASKATFNDAKSLVESFLRSMALEPKYEALELGCFAKGRCAGVTVDGMPIGVFGEIHPRTLLAFGYENPVLAWEFRM